MVTDGVIGVIRRLRVLLWSFRLEEMLVWFGHAANAESIWREWASILSEMGNVNMKLH